MKIAVSQGKTKVCDAPTKRLKCSCKNEYQDRLYGKGRRVHNPCQRLNGIGYRCTTCLTER